MKYRNYIEKVAAGGFIGFNLGGIGGLMGGAMLGGAAATLTHRQTPEHKKIRNEYNKIISEGRKLDNDLWDARENVGQFPNELYEKLNTPEMDQKTVKEVEDYADELYRSYRKNRSLSKTAGFKSGLALGALGGAALGIPLGYTTEKNDRTNTKKFSDGIKSQTKLNDIRRKELNDLKAGKISSRTALQNTDYADGYTPYLMSRNHQTPNEKYENDYFYGEAVDEYLKRKKQDISKMKWRDYKNLVDSHINNINEGVMPWEV